MSKKSAKRVLFFMDMGITEHTKVCYNCNYFYPHYNEGGILLWRGHCSYPRLKDRQNLDTCKRFEQKGAGKYV